MKRRFAVFVAVLLASCASSTTQPIHGRYALSFADSSMAYRYMAFTPVTLPVFARALKSELETRGASVDLVADPNSATGYDGVILVSWTYNNARIDDRAQADASGTQVSRDHIGKLSYDLLRGGSRVANGSVNMTMISMTGQDREGVDPGPQTTAAHALAADIAKKLAKGNA